MVVQKEKRKQVDRIEIEYRMLVLAMEGQFFLLKIEQVDWIVKE